MAYASLLSLTQTLEQTLQSQSSDQSRDESQLALREEQLHMRSLHGKLSNLLSFLETSSPKNQEIISSLEGKIRDATYEAEDLIELRITKQIISQGVMVEENYNEGLQNVLEKLDSILKEVDKMKEKNDGGGMQPSKYDDASFQIKDPHIGGLPSILESDSSVKMDGIGEAVLKVHSGKLSGDSSSESASTNQMVGFSDDLLRIKDLLTGSSTRLETISIVGMGGIGKTTLARNIYDASFAERHFDIRAWTTVSQEYSEVALLVDLLLRIKDLLTGSSTRLETISIVGMGGIGKTTLARNIYDASFAERHFDIRAWTTVSQEYSEENPWETELM